MTDTVNVPREWLVRFVAWVEEWKGTATERTVDEMLSLYTDASRFALAAAPKAEPVIDPCKFEPLLWSMHILGPDDVYPAPDLATAFKWCEYVNSQLAPRTPDVLCAAIPALWDGTPEQHAKSLPDAIKGWTVPERPEAQKAEQEPVAWEPASAAEDWREYLVTDDSDTVNKIVEVQPLYSHPAQASDELLEAAKFAAEAIEVEIEELQNSDNPSWTGLHNALVTLDESIAKHKGPQS